MLYNLKFDEEKSIFIKAPDKFEHDIAIKICIVGHESEYISTQQMQDSELPTDSPFTNIEDFLHPSIFINEKDDMIVPDIYHMQYVNREFMEDMLYLWSKTKRHEFIRLVDKIDDNLDFLMENRFNSKYAAEEEFELSVGRFNVPLPSQQKKKCDCEDCGCNKEEELIKEALKSYGKLSNPSDYVFGIVDNLNGNGYILVLTPVEFWKKFHCMYRAKLFLPDNFFPSYVKEEIDHCVYEIDDIGSIEFIKNDLIDLGFVFEQEFQDYVEKQKFVVKVEKSEEI